MRSTGWNTSLGRGFGYALIIAIAAGCAPNTPDAEGTGVVASAQYFEQATRRDPTAGERSRVAWLGGCTAFFVENTSETTFIATAFHCVGNDMEGWCAGGGRVHAAVAPDISPGCSRVIATDLDSDVAVFEADLPPWTKRWWTAKRTFRLAAYDPKPRTRLVMTGYPNDVERRGALTTTENCWTLGERDPHPHRGTTMLLSSFILHNCSTWGGNSGGPMAIEGTRDAVGMPATFQLDSTRRSATDPSTAARLAPMSTFVGKHRDALLAAGIVIADTQDATVPDVAATTPTPIGVPAAPPPETAVSSVSSEDDGCALGGRQRGPTSPLPILAVAVVIALAKRRRVRRLQAETSDARHRSASAPRLS